MFNWNISDPKNSFNSKSIYFSLHDMIEAGLHRISDRLEEIGSSAGKEFALETAMEKMKQESLDSFTTIQKLSARLLFD